MRVTDDGRRPRPGGQAELDRLVGTGGEHRGCCLVDFAGRRTSGSGCEVPEQEQVDDVTGAIID